MHDRPGSFPATRPGRWILRALCVAALAPSCGGRQPAPGLPWHGSQPFRVPVSIGAAGHVRHDLAASVEWDPRRMAAAPPQGDSLRVVEVDEAGVILDGEVPFQFDPGEEDRADSLVLWLGGETGADASRRFLVYLGTVGGGPGVAVEPRVRVSETVDEEQESYRIETPGATWYFHRHGAGFSSLEDAGGHDWIGFRPEGGSAGQFRGIPNLVYPEGYFHPGGSGCRSRLTARGPLRASIDSECGGGEWAARWDIHPGYARLTVLRAPRPFWFLYEGTPGGALDERDLMVLASGESQPAARGRDGDLPGPEWLYFADTGLGRALFLAHHHDDRFADAYFPMEGNMTVFGFGREQLNGYLRRTPSRFSVGLVEGTDPTAVWRVVAGFVEPLKIRVGPLERKPGPGS